MSFPVVLLELTYPLTVTSISDYWTELTGQPTSEALGVGWMKRLDANSVSVPFSVLETELKAGRDVAYVVRCKGRDEQWCWLRVVVRPVDAAAGLQHMSAVAVPVPEMSGGVQLQEMARAQAASDALLDSTPDLIFHLGAEGTYLGYRAGGLAELMMPPERFLGKRFEEVMSPAIARDTREAFDRARATGQPQTFSYSLSLPEGGARHYEARLVPLPGGDSIAHIRDVTQQRRAEAELVAAREEALERSRLKTQFLANVSHEIRTPLNGILGVTQLLKQQQLPADLAEYVDVLQNAGESLLGIVNDVLDLSKIEANRLELEPRVFDLEQVVVETVRMFSAQAQKKKLELLADVSLSARGPVRGDATRVRQILNNLVGNAIKFTDAGEVRVTLSRAAERIKLVVKDTGPGIAPENQSRIFEAFEQGDVAVQRRFGGTGLGLAITRRIARLMGGEVTVRSTPGQGSEFELEVPLPSVVMAPVVPVARPELPPRSLRVLLAEDDGVNATMTAALLSKLGHEVRVVSNGRDCIEAVGRDAPDLVLMDVHMPQVDGLEATRLIREAERSGKRHVPIVALTANAMKGDDLRCLSAGMDAYLPKPVTVAALKDLLSWFGSQ